LVCNKKAHEFETTGSTGATRPSLRNGFTAYFVLSSVSRAFLPPSSCAACRAEGRHRPFAELDPSVGSASGDQDHTTSPSAKASFVRAAKPRSTPSRPSHSASCVRDDRDTPLLKEAGRANTII